MRRVIISYLLSYDYDDSHDETVVYFPFSFASGSDSLLVYIVLGT